MCNVRGLKKTFEGGEKTPERKTKVCDKEKLTPYLETAELANRRLH